MNNVITTTCGLCSTGCRINVHCNEHNQYSIKGDKCDPVTHGALCKKGLHAIDIMLHPERLTQPLKRTGKRGEDQWITISWQQALDEIALKFNHTQNTFGDNSLFFSYGYSKDFINTQLLKLANAANSVNIHGPETVCWAPSKYGKEYTLGYNPGADINQHTDCIIFWGVNKHNTRFTEMRAINHAIEHGATTICVDPQQTHHAKNANYWLPLVPGSDLALAMAMIKIIIDKAWYDTVFVADFCYGFSALQSHVDQLDLSYLANECQLSIEMITDITQQYINAKSAVIITGNALDHNPDSFQVNRAIAILMALSGNIEIQGGQSKPQGKSLVNGRWPYDPQDVDQISPTIRRHSVGSPPIPESFRSTSQGLMDAMLTGQPYSIKAGLIVGTNPMTSWPDSNKVKQAFEQLDFLVVSELFMTPTAMMADIVLPAASFFEYAGVTQGQDGSIHYQASLQQVGDAKPDHQIITEIGHAMGIMPVYNDNDFWKSALSPVNIDLMQLKAQTSILAAVENQQTLSYLSVGFDTPSGKVELYSQKLHELTLDPIPVYRPNLSVTDRYPLRVTTAKSRHYMFSHGRQISSLRARHPFPIVKIHSSLGEKEHLKEGDIAAIETAPDKIIYQRVKFDDNLNIDTIIADLSWWFPEMKSKQLSGAFISNYNVLTTTDTGTHSDIGSFYINGLPCRIYKATNIELSTI